MGIFSVDLNNINLDDIDSDEDDPGTITHVRLIAWCNRFKQCIFKNELSKVFMLVAWHLRRWWCWRMPKDEKKRNEFIDEKQHKVGK